MKPSTILKRAKKLIERGWCKHTFATDADGKHVNPLGESARHWCVEGALLRIVNDDGALWDAAFHYLGRSTGGRGVAEFNDQQETSASVLEVFDRAIKLAIKEGN
jgi:hypothetical protein